MLAVHLTDFRFPHPPPHSLPSQPTLLISPNPNTYSPDSPFLLPSPLFPALHTALSSISDLYSCLSSLTNTIPATTTHTATPITPTKPLTSPALPAAPPVARLFRPSIPSGPFWPLDVSSAPTATVALPAPTIVVLNPEAALPSPSCGVESAKAWSERNTRAIAGAGTGMSHTPALHPMVVVWTSPCRRPSEE